jgi:hypothetical protein
VSAVAAPLDSTPTTNTAATPKLTRDERKALERQQKEEKAASMRQQKQEKKELERMAKLTKDAKK